MKTFKVGDRVVHVKDSSLEEWNADDYDDTIRGVVKGIHKSGKLLIEWDLSWRNKEHAEAMPDELISEAEANKILSKLEAEYKAWADPIKEKVEQAAKLLREAGKMASKQKKELIEMHDLVYPLLGTMDGLGWSTSSLSC